jgi:hypothetical protein
VIPSDRDGIWGALLAFVAALVLATFFWCLGLPRFARTAGRRATFRVMVISHLLGGLCIGVFFAALIAITGITSLSDYLKTTNPISFLAAVVGCYFVLSALCGLLRISREPGARSSPGAAGPR